MDEAGTGAGDGWSERMRGALAGDDGAYGQLLADLARAFRIEARQRLIRAGRGNADIEDIVQEALLAIHLKRTTWDPARPLAAWAYAILSYKITDRLRRDRAKLHEPIDPELPLAAPEDTGAATRGDVLKMLDRLSEPQRRIVLAMSIEGRSASEVARQTGASEGAVRVALHRALKRLALMFGEERP